MKKLLLFAVSVTALMISCMNKGQKGSADGKDSLAAVIDSIIEENDTTPMPMFLIGDDGKYALMLYWSPLEEPKKSKEYPEYFEEVHRRWALQEMFRRNKTAYTNMLMDDRFVKIKFIDEVLKDPDGNTPSIGMIHGRKEIPSLCARFDFANPKDKKKGDYGYEWGSVIITDGYLNTRKLLDVKSCLDNEDNYPSLPADIVKQLESKYGMKTLNSSQTCIIGNRYTMGAIEFKGEYKDAPKDKNDADRKFALALEVLIDSQKVYVLEQLGYYDPEYGGSWNADADGYYPNTIEAAFEGPKGLELCFTHGSPEGFCVGMLFPREDKLIEQEYEGYYNCIDEQIPVWKKDLAEMDKMYHDDEKGDRDVELTKWAHAFIDYDNEWIWLRDKDDEHGAIFLRKDGKLTLIAIENPRRNPLACQKDGISYLKLSGSAGGSSWQEEIHAFKDGKRLWRLNVLKDFGEIEEADLNGKDITKEQAQAYLDQVPQGEKIIASFTDIKK